MHQLKAVSGSPGGGEQLCLPCHPWAQILFTSQGEGAFLGSLSFHTNKMGTPQETLK